MLRYFLSRRLVGHPGKAGGSDASDRRTGAPPIRPASRLLSRVSEAAAGDAPPAAAPTPHCGHSEQSLLGISHQVGLPELLDRVPGSLAGCRTGRRPCRPP
jgi:hypothetical protein